jgi:hypothetical protein
MLSIRTVLRDILYYCHPSYRVVRVNEYTREIKDDVYIVIDPDKCDVEKGLGH